MELSLTQSVVAALKKAGCKSPALSDENVGFRGLDLDTRQLADKDLDIIRKVLAAEPWNQDPKNRRVLRQLDALNDIKAGKAKEMKVKNLESLPDILKALIGPTKHKWLFIRQETFEIMLPWFVVNIHYHPPEKTRDSYVPAKVVMNLKAVRRGSEDSKTITFEREDIKKSCQEILDGEGCLLETPALLSDYEKSMVKYREHVNNVGHQYLGRGFGTEGSSSWSHDVVALERDGRPTKVIVDDSGDKKDDDGRDTDSGYSNTKFWSKDYHGDDDEEGEEAWKLPVHPIVRYFNLYTHDFETTHIDNLEPYPYDTAMGKKLVLPDDHRTLIDALTNTAIARMDDIVQGKATGVILMCSGKPGTGKTLTAEVYSEVAKRPLYAVQCSQLGTNEEELEKKLTEVLGRATRWGAILLIDEADVYIHERGNDLGQNAIVGVFLRLLEYYSGILFLTTNRETIIDDAILSRVTAHVRYDVPQDEKAVEAWKVLSEQYGADNLSPKECAKAFPGVSGRSIRQLLKLASVMAATKKSKVTVEQLKWAAKYQDFPEKDQEQK